MVKEEGEPPPQSPPLTVLVAVKDSIKSAYAVLWALEKHTGENILLRLLHVCPTIKAVPTEMGNYIPISGVRPEVLEAYKKDVEWEINKMFLSYERLGAKRKVEMEVMVIEVGDVPEDVPKTIAKVVSMFKISKLVIGASSQSWLRRVLNVQNLSSKICECVPSFCSAHIVSKEKVIECPPTSNTENSTGNTSNGSSNPVNTGSNYNSSAPTGTAQLGSPQFQSLKNITKDSPSSRPNSNGYWYPLSAIVDSMDKKDDSLLSRWNTSDGEEINGRRTHSSRSRRSDWNASPISSSSDTHYVAARSIGTGIRYKETKH